MTPVDAEVRLRCRAAGRPTGARLLDMVVATLGLVCLTPVLMVISVATVLESGFPLLFSQVRLGEGGRLFRLYKFRKFGADRVGHGGAVTLKNDPRLTRVGKVLAQTKLDELPQLWNVLIGDMSIVGPRPETPVFAECFDRGYQKVLAFRPGIFGPNQVFLRNESSLYISQHDPEEFYRRILFPLKARTDLAYFPDRTLAQDIAWMMRGIGAVLGWSPMTRQGPELMDEIEAWIRRRQEIAPGRNART
jgi:lipopolysaccharide/colanic/teichoic acid biosynthesis glycosyltransferase